MRRTTQEEAAREHRHPSASLLVRILALAVALAILATTWSLIPASCGENRRPCDATSSTSLATVLSVIGLVGVVAAVMLIRSQRRRFASVVLTLTALVYLGWLFAFVFQLRAI